MHFILLNFSGDLLYGSDLTLQVFLQSHQGLMGMLQSQCQSLYAFNVVIT